MQDQDKLNCAVRTAQVSEQVQRLEKAIVRLAEVRSNLEERLVLILLPTAPASSEDRPEKIEVQLVPLAEELERLTKRVNIVANSMEYMLGRIEL